MPTFEVKINGDTREIKSTTVSELLSELKLENKRVAVELNRQIVSRDSYEKTVLSAGDSLEVVHFVGGG